MDLHNLYNQCFLKKKFTIDIKLFICLSCNVIGFQLHFYPIYKKKHKVATTTKWTIPKMLAHHFQWYEEI